MPKFIVTGPDNVKRKVTVPEGATEEQAISFVKNRYYSPKRETAAPIERVSKKEEPPGALKSALDAAATVASGAIAEPIAGISGALSGAYNLATGDSKEEALSKAARVVEGAREAFTWQPRTKGAQETLGAVGKILAPVEKALDVGGEYVSEATGSPLLGALTRAGVEMFPLGRATKGLVRVSPSKSMYGLGTIPKSVRASLTTFKSPEEIAAIKSSVEQAKKHGIDLTAPVDVQKNQFVQAAVRDIDGKLAIGGDLPNLANAVVSAKRNAKDLSDSLFETARGMKAGVPLSTTIKNPTTGQLTQSGLEKFFPGAVSSLSSFDLEEMPKVKKRLLEIGELYDTAKQARKKSVDLREIEKVRRRIVHSLSFSMKNSEEKAALNVLKGQLDSFIDDMFDAGMITGKADAISAWKSARSSWVDYSKRFNESKLIKKLIKEKNASPEEIKDWILGANAAGPKTESVKFVKALHQALTEKDADGNIIVDGKNSPQMNAIRREVMRDMMSPLLDEGVFTSPAETKNRFSKFRQRYEGLLKDNPTLMSELFDPASSSEMRYLSDYSKALSENLGFVSDLKPEQVLARIFVGNQLSKGTLRQQVATKIFSLILGETDSQRRNSILTSLSGYDPNVGIKDAITPLSSQSVLQSLIEQQNMEDQEKQKKMQAAPSAPLTRGTVSPSPPPQQGAAGTSATSPSENTQSRAMLESLFPNDSTIKMPQPPPAPA